MTAATAGMRSQEIITVAKPLGIAVHDHINVGRDGRELEGAEADLTAPEQRFVHGRLFLFMNSSSLCQSPFSLYRVPDTAIRHETTLRRYIGHL